DEGAERAGEPDCLGAVLDVLPARQPHRAELGRDGAAAELRRLLEQLGEREQADQYRDELDAVAERMDTEGVALHAGGEVLADGGEQYAEGAGDQVLGGAV